jgi:lysophospholipase L1-like esterase
MIECLIIGDSIAVGISKYRPECEVHAKVGITSRHWNNANKNLALQANTVIISLGSNDKGIDTEGELRIIRGRTHADHVYWVVPAKINKEIVTGIALQSHDSYITIDHPSKDGVHPTMNEYSRIAKETK